jgi:hypothetical protein
MAHGLCSLFLTLVGRLSLQFILDNSTHPYALHIASNSLTKLITAHWNNFSISQRIDIRKGTWSLYLDPVEQLTLSDCRPKEITY